MTALLRERPTLRGSMAFFARSINLPASWLEDELFDRCWHFGKCSSPVFNEPYEKSFVGALAARPLYYLGSRAIDLLVRNYVFDIPA